MDKVKKKVVENANAHVNLNLELRENMHSRWNRCFVLANISDSKIKCVYATKRGAQNKLKRLKGETYYSDYSQEMVSYGAGLDIVEVKAEELLEIDDAQLWYNTLWYEYQNFYCDIDAKFDYYVKKYKVSKDIIEMIKEYSKEIRKGSFPHREELHKNLTVANCR